MAKNRTVRQGSVQAVFTKQKTIRVGEWFDDQLKNYTCLNQHSIYGVGHSHFVAS